ncbi:MAG TPA: hypothetical protein VII06_28885 [Chloroflexota bacterium]
MIRTKRQYENTKRQAEHFAPALATADATDPGRPPEMQALLKAALVSQLDDLRAEITDYERRSASRTPRRVATTSGTVHPRKH